MIYEMGKIFYVFYRKMEIGTCSCQRKQALEERGQGMSDTFGGKHESG